MERSIKSLSVPTYRRKFHLLKNPSENVGQLLSEVSAKGSHASYEAPRKPDTRIVTRNTSWEKHGLR